jgi:phosphoribosyl-ATP pyrophosphohydrolase/phosphoribosyl-AMP cyclohydrolase
VNPVGPVCHKGDDTCFEEVNKSENFIEILEDVIQNRKNNLEESSYISNLFKKGTNKIAQKVGEEAVEMVIEAKDNNGRLFLNESADLLFHYLILLQDKGYKMKNVIDVLKSRSK